MRRTIVILLIGLTVGVFAEDDKPEYYTGKWNDLNTHDIIDNSRLFKKYKQCILADSNVGCPQEVIELKKVLPEALETVCSKCSTVQVEKIRDTLKYVCEKRKADFDELLKHIDPEGAHRPKFEEKFGALGC
ncbi:ejaculatory bulb-specific protein 3-like [Prorops nasuta]|uniref:ejaculatory bulb-specific protein 3-like n=1 Tax=Prorops nasuta TaxID=863751 RepID=UPI0034CF88EA